MSNYIVDSADLTSVANAIRTKGGTSASLAFPAEFVSAIAAIPTGGGGTPENMKSGSVTLAETGNLTIDVGGQFSRFLLVAQSSVLNNTESAKVNSQIYADLSNVPTYNYIYVSTNNSGTSNAAYAGWSVTMGNDRTDEYYRVLNNSRLTYYGPNAEAAQNRIVLVGSTSGTAFGKFLAGIEYKWWAW